MTETVKTCAFVAAAALAISLAMFSTSRDDATTVQQLVGTYLNNDIDVAAPRRLQIARFDRQTADVRQFEVAELDGVWSIPSKDNYPADATQQMADAATCVIDRKVLRVAGDSAQSHEEFGVVDPLASKLDSKSVGVGTHVTMTDADDAVLVDMIVGKAVRDNPTQRYVRRANQDVVYVVELDPTKLSTDFADWIEKDLLKLNAMDLRKVFVNDYSADLSVTMSNQGLVPRITQTPRNEMTLVHNEESAPWELASITKFDPAAGAMAADALAEGEEVNQESVQGLITGLDELAIVDVSRKPAGLSADLKAGEAFLNNEEAVSDLVQRGFLPGRQESGADMLASEGEVVFTLRNGVEYVLRFGQLQVQTESQAGGEAEDAAQDPAAEEAADAATAATEADDDEGKDLRRYVFVMARFNEDAVEKPAYQELPALPAEDADATSTAAEGDSTEDGADEDDADDDATDDADAAKDREAILAERKQIEEENDRIREEYESLISEGQAEVASLNDRFGDWYFVISNDVYKKIHLGRDQLVKPKDAPATEGAGETAPPSGLEGVPGLEGLVPPATTP